MRRGLLIAVAAVALLAAGIDAQAPLRTTPGRAPASDVRFTDVTAASGLDFRHVNGASPDKHLAETMGSGGALFDYDNDGWLDVFLVDGGSLTDPTVAGTARHRLYRNTGGGRFADVSATSGITHGDYGMGACAGDVDNDGWIDLFVTSFGRNTLYRNRQGRFSSSAGDVGERTPQWSVSCAFLDADKDGDLDLFVVNYVDAPVDRNPFCGNARTRLRFYCHPHNYTPLPNTLYRNDGRGVFTDVSDAAGISRVRSNGLGVVVSDYDADGWPDVFVANDSLPNFLFRNMGNGRFEEVALRAGVAVATDGRARAGMGIDAGDYDGDGLPDLVVTNLDFETHSLYRSLGNGLFAYATSESGLGFATLPFVGFGVVFVDADNDGRLDVAIANGHIMDNAPQFRTGATYAQRNLLFRNVSGRRFVEAGRGAGSGFALTKVSRALLAGDVDNDGDVDLLVTNNGQPADLLRNDTPRTRRALAIRLVGRPSNRDGVGARIRVTTGSTTQLREVKAGSSYLGQNDLRAHFGLAESTMADVVEITWPSGRVETLRNVPAGAILTIREGEGVSERRPFAE